MPLYSFECEDCQAVFDLRASFQEKEKGLEPVCPQCNGQHAHQLITVGWLLSGRGATGATTVARAPACGCGAGGGCCG